MPNFIFTRENYSQYQAWCEGTLMSSQEVISKLNCVLETQSIIKQLKKSKKSKKSKK